MIKYIQRCVPMDKSYNRRLQKFSELLSDPEVINYAKQKGIKIQEIQNGTIITLRMRYHKMRWSVKGGNNLTKTLYQKENKELANTIDRYTDRFNHDIPLFEAMQMASQKTFKKTGY